MGGFEGSRCESLAHWGLGEGAPAPASAPAPARAEDAAPGRAARDGPDPARSADAPGEFAFSPPRGAAAELPVLAALHARASALCAALRGDCSAAREGAQACAAPRGAEHDGETAASGVPTGLSAGGCPGACLA